jgi:transcriptional regulator of NAD metabolism
LEAKVGVEELRKSVVSPLLHLLPRLHHHYCRSERRLQVEAKAQALDREFAN